MDKEALQYLTSANTSQILNDVLSTLGTDSPVAALPDNFSLANLDRYRINKSRFLGKFETDSISDFRNYCGSYTTQSDVEKEVFVDGKSMSATAIFNLWEKGEPGHGDHKAQLKLQKTPSFSALIDCGQQRYSQKELVHFLEDWSTSIRVKTNSKQDLSLAHAISAVSKVTIENAKEMTSEVHDFDSTASVLERSAAKNKEQLPSIIEFKTTPYSGLSERTFNIRVSLATSSGEPKFRLRVIGLEVALDEITEEFKGLVESKLKDLPVEVYIGNFSIV